MIETGLPRSSTPPPPARATAIVPGVLKGLPRSTGVRLQAGAGGVATPRVLARHVWIR